MRTAWLESLRAKFGADVCVVQLDVGTVEAPSGDAGGGPAMAWHTVALEGAWDGHRQGAFEVTESMLNQMKRNARALKVDTPVDYEHNSLNMFAAEAPAAGWISDFRVNSAGSEGPRTLQALIGWNARAAEQIRNREYRYLSPVIVFNSRDRKTGKDRGAWIHSVALTNVPFLDELPEVKINSMARALGLRVHEPETQPMFTEKQYAELAIKLGLKPEATPDQILVALSSMRDEHVALRRICEALELDPDTECARAEGEILALRDRAEAAEGELVAARASANAIEAADRVRRAKDAGFVTAKNAQWVETLASENPEGFDAWFDSAVPVVPMSGPKPRSPKTKREAVEFKAQRVESLDDLHPSDDDVTRARSLMTERELKYCRENNIDPMKYAQYNAHMINGS